MSLLSSDEETLLNTVLEASLRTGMQASVVGGFPRDMLFSHLFASKASVDKDIDFLIEGDAGAFCQAVQSVLGGKIHIFPEFLTAKITDPDTLASIQEVDFASARSEVYTSPGQLPEVSSATLEKDLARRDFTINAMAIRLEDLLAAQKKGERQFVRLSSSLIDPFSGKDDLKNRIIRVLHINSFKDDPTRIFRALRYAARYNFQLEEKTLQLLNESIERRDLREISSYRILTELKKIFRENDYYKAICLVLEVGALKDLGITDTERLDEFVSDLKLMKTLSLKNCSDLAYKTALRIFYFYGVPDQRKNEYLRMKLGKKFILRAEQDEKFKMGEPIEKVSDEGLSFLLIRFYNQKAIFPALMEEGIKRQLLAAPPDSHAK